MYAGCRGVWEVGGRSCHHPPTQEATAVEPWRNAQRVFFEALAKEDMLRRVSPKIPEAPRLSSHGAPHIAEAICVRGVVPW